MYSASRLLGFPNLMCGLGISIFAILQCQTGVEKYYLGNTTEHTISPNYFGEVCVVPSMFLVLLFGLLYCCLIMLVLIFWRYSHTVNMLGIISLVFPLIKFRKRRYTFSICSMCIAVRHTHFHPHALNIFDLISSCSSISLFPFKPDNSEIKESAV